MFFFRSCGSEDDFYLNCVVEKAGQRLGGPPLRRQASHQDRSSVSSGESGQSAAHSTYDHPKTVLKVRHVLKCINESCKKGNPKSSDGR